MIVFENMCVIPIGCSCINQFQILHRFTDSPIQHTMLSAIFDWNIVTPGSTLEFFQYARRGELESVLCNRENYVIDHGKLRNLKFDEWYFYHENVDQIRAGRERDFNDFTDKVAYLVVNLLRAPAEHDGKRLHVNLLWSNLQPNLRAIASELNIDWGKFVLTRDLYSRIRETVADVLGSNHSIRFICRRADVEDAIIGADGVTLIELEPGPDFQGGAGLYDSVFSQLGL